MRLERESRVPQTHRHDDGDTRKSREKRLLGQQMASGSDIEIRRRAHVERMLARAEKRSRQVLKIVEKWKARLADLEREGVAVKQPRLWQDEQPPHEGGR